MKTRRVCAYNCKVGKRYKLQFSLENHCSNSGEILVKIKSPSVCTQSYLIQLEEFRVS